MNEDFEILKKYMPKRYYKTLAEKFGVTEMTVFNSLKRKNRRFDILASAVEMARESKRSLEELEAFTSETRKEKRIAEMTESLKESLHHQ
jgi:predicted nucleotidyltransferase